MTQAYRQPRDTSHLADPAWTVENANDGAAFRVVNQGLGNAFEIAGSDPLSPQFFIDQSGVLPPLHGLPQRPADYPYTVVTTDIVTGWTKVGAGTVSNDPTDFMKGSSSALITSDGSGSTYTDWKNITFNIPTANKDWVVWVKCDDPSKVNTLRFDFSSDTAFTSYWFWNVIANQAQEYMGPGDWVKITLAQATNIGQSGMQTQGTPSGNVLAARIRVKDNGVPTIVRFNGLGYQTSKSLYPNGVASIVVDDSRDSAYNVIRPYLDRYGMKASTAVIWNSLDTGGYLTTQQLRDLCFKSGWEVWHHALDDPIDHAPNPGWAGTSQQRLQYNIAKGRSLAHALGLGPASFAAYPHGQYSPALTTPPSPNVVLIEAQKNFLACRGTTVDYETIPPASPWKLRAINYMQAATSTATINTGLDNAVAAGAWCIYIFHHVVPSGATGSNVNTPNFQTVIDYLNTKGTPVRTVGEVMASLSRLY